MNPEDRINRYVDSLVGESAPKAFPATADEAPLMQVASELKAGRPGADLPSPAFLDSLERRLRREASSGRSISRRAALQVGGAAAAAVVAGVALDRLVLSREDKHPSASQASLDPAPGKWLAVAPLAAVPTGSALRFSAGAVEGFLVNTDGRIAAVSAVCTHLGCLLRLNAEARRFDCPCHGASFSLDGTPMNREYLVALPRLVSRVIGDRVEVRVDAQA